MEHHFVARITQEGGSAGHRGQDAALSFDTQVFVATRELGDPAN